MSGSRVLGLRVEGFRAQSLGSEALVFSGFTVLVGFRTVGS